MATDPCPICGTPVYVWERYPKALCNACAALARDEQGRPMRFGNETLLGTGFVAEVEVEGVWRRVDHGGLQRDVPGRGQALRRGRAPLWRNRGSDA